MFRCLFAVVLWCLFASLAWGVPVVDGHSSGTSTGSSTATVAITTSGTNRIIVVCGFLYSNTGVAQRTISGVADVAGLTWTARGAGVGGNFATNNNSFAQCWWALAAAQLTADTITVTASGATDTTSLFVFGCSGCNTTTPFDTNVALPAYASNLTSTGNNVSATGISTTNANTLMFSVWTSNANIGGSIPFVAPTGFTNQNQTIVSNASTFNDGQDATEIFSAAQTGITVTWDPGSLFTSRWLNIVDALQQASAAGSPAKNNLLMGISYDPINEISVEPIALRFHGSIPVTGTIPAVSSSTFYAYSPAANTQAVGTVTATCGGGACSGGNAITGWSITGGNTAGDFAISAAGAITVTSQGATDLDGATAAVAYTLTVTATNAAGTSSGQSIPITVYADGFAGAATATIQQASLLNTYHAGGGSNARAKGNGYQPAWNVAGVDYGTGVTTGTSLTDWQSIAGTIPGFTCNSGTGQCTATCSSGALTINAIDFTLHGGAYIVNSTNNCNMTITNSTFGTTPIATSTTIHVQTTNSNLTIKNCDFTSGNANYGGFIDYQASGTVSLTYNYFHKGVQHVLEQVAGTITLIDKFNFYYDMAWPVSCTGVSDCPHDNWLQWGTIGAGSTADVSFNGGLTDALQPNVAAGENFQFVANNSGTLTTALFQYNVMVATLFNSAATVSYMNHGGAVGAGTNINNFFDCTGCLGGPYYPNSMTAAQGWNTISGNKNMVTGATVTPWLLKRDLDPASNDNSPVWLAPAA